MPELSLAIIEQCQKLALGQVFISWERDSDPEPHSGDLYSFEEVLEELRAIGSNGAYLSLPRDLCVHGMYEEWDGLNLVELLEESLESHLKVARFVLDIQQPSSNPPSVEFVVLDGIWATDDGSYGSGEITVVLDTSKWSKQQHKWYDRLTNNDEVYCGDLASVAQNIEPEWY